MGPLRLGHFLSRFGRKFNRGGDSNMDGNEKELKGTGLTSFVMDDDPTLSPKR